MNDNDTVVILDFGSQYSQLIARRIRELNIYSKILPYNSTYETIMQDNPKGIILSGGPASVLQVNSPICDSRIFKSDIPVLGICYGLQLMVKTLGGEVAKCSAREYGKTSLLIKEKTTLFNNVPLDEINVWMSHGDKVERLPAGFEPIATTLHTQYAAVRSSCHKLIGIQFHPEVVHSEYGIEIIKSFCLETCRIIPSWTMKSYAETAIAEIKNSVGDSKVILALSGGVDSSVAAALISKAIGKNLTCIFVNNAVLRKNEVDNVMNLYAKNFNINVICIDAEDRFLSKLANIIEPEEKRKIIGNEFIKVFEESALEIKDVKFLAQGTTYPDVIESVSIAGNPSAMIKSHHNVGGLPEKMKLKLLEPLRALFKDEVRQLGFELGLPKEVVMRQPFPGPGLAVRIIGDLTREKIETLQEADAIVVDEMKKADLYYKTWQAFAVLLPIKTVGVMGDERTYENVVALRIVDSSDGMTADWVRLPYELLAKISSRIVSEVKGINRVVYDITSKPPGTIEWE